MLRVKYPELFKKDGKLKRAYQAIIAEIMAQDILRDGQDSESVLRVPITIKYAKPSGYVYVYNREKIFLKIVKQAGCFFNLIKKGPKTDWVVCLSSHDYDRLVGYYSDLLDDDFDERLDEELERRVTY